MPAYNSAKYIGAAVKSILNQSFKEFEFLIIDDGSTDNTEEIVCGFGDSRINYQKIKHKGTSGALNFGIRKASYEWIARLDADDVNVPGRLQTQVSFLDQNPDCDVVSSWSIYFRGDRILYFLQDPVEHSAIYKFLDLHNPVNQSAVIYRKRIFSHGKFDESCMYNEDFEFFRRIRDKVRFHNIPEYLAFIRIHDSSKSNLQDNKNIYDFVFPEAMQNLMNTKSKRELYYWTTIIAWINFFYGDKKESRKFLLKSSSLKNFLAYMFTFLPEKYFHALVNARPRLRLESFFKEKRKYREQLIRLLTNS